MQPIELLYISLNEAKRMEKEDPKRAEFWKARASGLQLAVDILLKVAVR